MAKTVKKLFYVFKVSDKKMLTQPDFYHVAWNKYKELTDSGEYEDHEIEIGTIEPKSKLKKTIAEDPTQMKLGGREHVSKNSKGLG